MDRKEVRARVQQVLEQYAKSPDWTPRQEIGQSLFWKTIRAEFVASLILMVFSTSSEGYLGSISYGCVVTILTYSLKSTNIHFNPIITVTAFLLHDITSFRCLSSILSQTIGTISGAAIVSFGLSSNSSTPNILPTLTVNPATGFGFEFFGTLVIIMTVAPQLEHKRDDPLFPAMLGLAFGTASSVSRYATGGFFNPIRAFALALFRNDCWESHYVYWIGPTIGGLIGYFTYDFIRPNKKLSDPGANQENGINSLIRHDSEFTQADTELTIATLT